MTDSVQVPIELLRNSRLLALHSERGDVPGKRLPVPCRCFVLTGRHGRALCGLCPWESSMCYGHRLKRHSLLQRLLLHAQPLCSFPAIVLSPDFVTSLRKQMKLQNLDLSFNLSQAFT